MTTFAEGGYIVGPSAPSEDSVPALLAPGGWRVPTEYVYTFTDVEPELVELLLPGFTIKRGGIRYPPGPVRHYRWRARTRWGRRIKRLLWGVEWIDR